MRVLLSGISTTCLFLGIGFLHGRSTIAVSPPKPCSEPEYRQFDFWLGDWDVRGPKGKQAGVNHVRSLLGGCVLQENWTGTGGSVGTSFNIYDRTQRQWHQTWVDNQGTLLQLDGRFADGRMTLQGATSDSTGAKALQRITWSQPRPGEVRQLWETSIDGGKKWTVAFDGLYVKQH
jgi:hypothetical protein